MSYDPDRPRPEREPETSGPWMPPRLMRGPVNPPETYRKAKAHVAVRNVRPSRWTKRDVYREMPVGSIMVSAQSPDAPVGSRWVGSAKCPVCDNWVDQLVHQPLGIRARWACVDCTPDRVRRLHATNWDLTKE